MLYDIVWADQSHVGRIADLVKRPSLEERFRNRWKYGWTVWPNCLLPKADGSISKEGGFCIAGTRPGIAQLKPMIRKDHRYVIADKCKLTEIEPGLVAGELDPSVWEDPAIIKEAQRNLDLAKKLEDDRINQALERQKRNLERQETMGNMSRNWAHAAAAIMGVEKPRDLDDTTLFTLSIMAKHSPKGIVPIGIYLTEFAEQLKPEPEPEFLPSDDVEEFLGFSMRAYSACVAQTTKVKKI